MASCKPLLVCAVVLAVVGCGKAPASQVTQDSSVYANYSAIQVAKDGDIESAAYSLGADGSNRIPGSDVVMSVRFCPRSSPFVCATGDFYHFAVPRHDLTAGEKWQFAGRTYELVPGYLPHAMFEQAVHSKDVDRTVRIFNSEITVNVIRTVSSFKGETCIEIYLYSHDHGVLGNLGRCDDHEKHDSWDYWLTSSDGIDSPTFEKAISPEAVMTQAEAVALYNQR